MPKGIPGSGPRAKAAVADVVQPKVVPNVKAEGRSEPVRQANNVVVRRQKPPVPKVPPDMILVRAVEKGFYGFERDMIVRNPGEVFEMATMMMRKWPLEKGEHPVEGATIIDVTNEDGTVKGQYELPGWVELADEATVRPEEFEKHGIAPGMTIRTQVTPDGTRNMAII